MSVRRSGSGGDWEYAGHEVHHVTHEVDFLGSADAGPSNDFADSRTWEVTDRGLDRDELAELRGIKVSFSLQSAGDPSAQSQIGSVRGYLGAGYNIEGSEWLSWGADTDFVDDDDSGTDDYRIQTKATGEQGQIVADRIASFIGFGSGADGAGGAAGLAETNYFLDFSRHFGRGPVLDSNDDLKTRIRLDVNNSVIGIGATASLSLYYVLHEFEGGRPEFGHHHHAHGH